MKRIALIVLMLLSLAANAGEGRKWAVVNTSLCYLRAEPDYESALESQALMGTVVEITAADGYWRRVNVPDYRNVWTNELVLAEMDDSQLEEYRKAPKWICTAAHSVLYSRPDAGSPRVSDFLLGDVVRKSGKEMVRRGGVEWAGVVTASGDEAWVPASDVADLESWTGSRHADGESLVRTALGFTGIPYLWGGASVNGFDCSGFVKTVYLMCGIVLPRNAREQILCGSDVPYDIDLMQPGDLVFYGSRASDGSIRSVSHVAMYIGNGRIIHSSQLVRVNSIVPGSDGYYGREAVGVRRLLGSQDSGTGVWSIAARPWFLQ